VTIAFWIAETKIPIALVRRRLSGLAETVSGVCASAASNCRPDDIGIVAVVVAELNASLACPA
jgi:hypothetical protein